MEKQIIGKPTQWYTILWCLVFGVLLLISLKGLISETHKLLGISSSSFWTILIHLIILLLIFFSHFKKPDSLVFIHESLHALKAMKYGYEVKLTVYNTFKERKERGSNGYCKFKDGAYSKDNIKKVYLGPFKFFISIYIFFLISAFCTESLMSILFFILAIVSSLQLPGCIADLRGAKDIRKSDKSISIVYYGDEDFYFEK